jgi:hypothetical protein
MGTFLSPHRSPGLSTGEVRGNAVGFPWEEIHEVQYAVDAPGLEELLAGSPS